MTVTSLVNKIVYTGDGSTVIFPYTFKVFASSELVVEQYTIADGTTTALTETTEYSVSGVDNDAGGNVTLVTTISSDYKLIIRRLLPLTNTSDLVENDNSSAETQEDTHDKSVMRDQQLQEQLNRAILLASSETTAVEFPSPSADQIIGWNSDGDALENKTDESVQAGIYADEA